MPCDDVHSLNGDVCNPIVAGIRFAALTPATCLIIPVTLTPVLLTAADDLHYGSEAASTPMSGYDRPDQVTHVIVSAAACNPKTSTSPVWPVALPALMTNVRLALWQTGTRPQSVQVFDLSLDYEDDDDVLLDWQVSADDLTRVYGVEDIASNSKAVSFGVMLPQP